MVAYCAGENFRSWWWRSVSSPLQVSGAVTRLAVYRAAPHTLQRRGSTQKVIVPRGKRPGKQERNLGRNLGRVLSLAGNSTIRFDCILKSGVV